LNLPSPVGQMLSNLIFFYGIHEDDR
jgi:hypothetical protein